MRGLPAENLITSQWQRGWQSVQCRGGEQGAVDFGKSEPRQRHIFHINEMLLIVHLTLVKCDLIVSANAKGQDLKKGHGRRTQRGVLWVAGWVNALRLGSGGNGSGSWLRYKLAQFLFNRNTSTHRKKIKWI